MRITEYMKDHPLFLDGGMGTLLQARGLTPGELPERWNLTHPDVITAIHRDYFDAGSHVVNANTFGASPLKFDAAELEQIVAAALAEPKIAKLAEGMNLVKSIVVRGKLVSLIFKPNK